MPSDCPFREEVLREVEEMRKRKEDEKEQRRYWRLDPRFPGRVKSKIY